MLPTEFTTVRLSKLGMWGAQIPRLPIVGNYLIEEILEKIELQIYCLCALEEKGQERGRKK